MKAEETEFEVNLNIFESFPFLIKSTNKIEQAISIHLEHFPICSSQNTPNEDGDAHGDHMKASDASRVSKAVIDGIFHEEFHGGHAAQVQQNHQQGWARILGDAVELPKLSRNKSSDFIRLNCVVFAFDFQKMP